VPVNHARRENHPGYPPPVYRVHAPPNDFKRFPIIPHKNISALWGYFLILPRLIVQGYFLTNATFGVFNINKAALKIYVIPFQLEHFPRAAFLYIKRVSSCLPLVYPLNYQLPLIAVLIVRGLNLQSFGYQL